MIRRPPRSPLFPSTTLFRSIRTEPPVELPIRDVQRHHPQSPALQEAIGEAPGRGAHIQALSPIDRDLERIQGDRKSTRLNSSHGYISYAVFCLKKKKKYKTYSLGTTNVFGNNDARQDDS